ncbi:hypothetical protein GUJ93_ZPchr0005g15394 [Zizania palustris]|uniref:Uncharacterized protein n=1 Tax=Zizania palustris TaxID=103762 RepID=A0A8J5SU52_ZIZPA|nr:hypothetical protein GUJ93_ZPchr0005g15394 [Zizania palustris]
MMSAVRNRLVLGIEARMPRVETTSEPREGEVVVFEAFFDAGLKFSALGLLGGVLHAFHMELSQLSLNVVARLAIFEWADRLRDYQH